MLNTKQDAAKNSASSEFLKNCWLSAHWACKQVWMGDGARFFFMGGSGWGGGAGGEKTIDLTNKTQNNGVFLDPSPVGLPGFTGGCDRGSGWPDPETRRVSGSHIHRVFVLKLSQPVIWKFLKNKLNTKQDTAKTFASSEFLKIHWLSVHEDCK